MGTKARRSHGPNWKGGRRINSKGYVELYLPEHPRSRGNGYVAEHIVLAERAVGKPLPSGAQVHHVNGDRADNRPENLVVCQGRAHHALIHVRMRAVMAGHPADWKQCHHCGGWAAPTDLLIYKRHAASHPECARPAERNRNRGQKSAASVDVRVEG